MNREQIKEKMVSAMDLPKDVIQNASVITILGRNELCIENYRGIIEYTDTLIRVQTRAGQIRGTIRTDHSVTVPLCEFDVNIFKQRLFPDAKGYIICTNHLKVSL